MRKWVILTLAVGGLCAVPGLACAQSQGSYGASGFQNGYGNARQATASSTTGSTRDSNGNRLIVDGIIQSGASAYSRVTGGYSGYGGVGCDTCGNGTSMIGGSTAIGNNLNVVVQGNHNTVIVNSRQINNGDVTAGAALNGTLRLP
jgi:hypothetical protein